ncbi:MAG: hypothetical protein HW383_194 [Candidatus Magasanikbacteria bacterium]|nr:hypothetical protein [Candidatus Magasanikbacteria bacterium]
MFYVVCFILVGAAIALYFGLSFRRAGGTEFGVTFIKTQAEYFGLDWKKTYLSILRDLKVRHLRLAGQWNAVEWKRGTYWFGDLDWQVKEAEKVGAKIIMVVGRRVPRWPECHDPDWVKSLPPTEVAEAQLKMVAATVEHFKNSSTIIGWQVENEPFLEQFGICPPPDPSLFDRELAMVRSLDTRPIIVTDSGELSTWRRTAHLGDIFGSTLYRVVKWRFTKSIYIRYDYFFPPAFFKIKQWLNGISDERFIISELQAEPWLIGHVEATSLAEQKKSMSAEQLLKNVETARRIGAREAYLWGVEYWYWLKERKWDSSLYNAAGKIWE